MFDQVLIKQLNYAVVSGKYERVLKKMHYKPNNC